MSVPVRPAASIIVIDDRPDLHVLLGKRREDSAFVGGMIVFPGGGVDDVDRSDRARRRVPVASIPDLDPVEAAAFLHAGIRETAEEVGLRLVDGGPADPDDFPHVGHWITPERAPRRYDTHFFLARHRGGEPAPDRIELVEVWWERPAATLERVGAGELDAIAPTIAFLESLAAYRSVAEAFAGTGHVPRAQHPAGWTSF